MSCVFARRFRQWHVLAMGERPWLTLQKPRAPPPYSDHTVHACLGVPGVRERHAIDWPLQPLRVDDLPSTARYSVVRPSYKHDNSLSSKIRIVRSFYLLRPPTTTSCRTRIYTRVTQISMMSFPRRRESRFFLPQRAPRTQSSLRPQPESTRAETQGRRVQNTPQVVFSAPPRPCARHKPFQSKDLHCDLPDSQPTPDTRSSTADERR